MINGFSILHRIKKTQRGATAVEFGLVSPAILLLMFGVAECSLMYFTQNLMENAAYNAARMGKTGYLDPTITDPNKAREKAIIDTINKYAGFYLDMTSVKLTSKVYKQFGDAGTGEPYIDSNSNGVRDDGENFTDLNNNKQYESDVGTAGYGSEKDVVLYTIDYPWKIATPILAKVIGAQNDIVPLQARLVVRNEPYGL